MSKGLQERNVSDLSHFIHTCGKLGRLQTLAILPTLPGDSFELALDGIARLAPLRKEVVSETQVDLLAFWVPHRHVYSNWPTFVQEGYNSTETFPTFAVGGTARDLSYLTLHNAGSAIPMYVLQGYNMIWDRFFRVPSMFRDPDYETFPSTTTQDDRDWRLYGRRCARLPHPVNDVLKESGGGADQPWRNLDVADWTYEATVTGGDAFIDLRALETVRGQYRSKIERTWFTERYTDILERQWGTSVNIDADQRPELCFRETINMSGHEVDGTDDATLGQYMGKTVSRVGMHMPRKFFNEHGALWVVALLRHPYVHIGEQNRLVGRTNIPNSLLMGDPDIMATLPPVIYAAEDYLADAYAGPGFAGPYKRPFGQEYRMQINNVHKHFADIPGYPFLREFVANPEDASYYQVGDYDDVFQTSQLAHWQIHARCNVIAHRRAPSATTSVYAGA